jgi:hypothetical protein
MTMPATGLTTGANTLTFRFNGTDGRVSGYRVLDFNVQDSGGNSLVDSSNFATTDPNTWQPPSTSPSDIAAGQSLWRTAALTVPSSSGPTAIKAHCMDCHAQDGRDLKYFNYSNLSISNRSVFHGLTAAQGNQIASYIRSLTTPNPGLPWNPPYQPGPGLDSQPVANWSAGAGLDAVLDSDADMMTGMFPTGVQPSFFAPTSVLNVRETAIALQLPDWNSWLPTIHPMDAWSGFTTNDLYTRYMKIRAELQPGSPTSYANASEDIETWGGNYQEFIIPKTATGTYSWTPTYVNHVYSTPLWTMVKNWELNQEFGLEGMANTVFTNPKAESRAWLSAIPFLTSPNMLHIPRATPGLDNGNLQTWTYLAFIWYHVQLILNNSEYQQHGSSPMDWGYVYAFVNELSQNDSGPQAALLNEWSAKAIQIENNGTNPSQIGTGWNWLVPDISRQVSPTFRGLWVGTPTSTRALISQGVVQGWLTEVQQFTAAEFWAGGAANPLRLPVPYEPDSSNFEDRVWYMIPRFHFLGASQTLTSELAAWAKTLWPLGNWTADAAATCAPDSADPLLIRCSTDK